LPVEAKREALALLLERERRRERPTLLEWTEKYRRIEGRPFTLESYPFMRAIYEDTSPVKALMKAAQVSATEYAINCMFWALDAWGMDVLYLLATGEDASDFSAGRMNPAIEESDRLSDLFTDVQNVGHKRAGNRSVYVRGSRRRTGLKSIPVDLLIIDEYDEMVQTLVELLRIASVEAPATPADPFGDRKSVV